MAQFSISELTTFRWSFEEDVANYVKAGIPAIGLWRQKLSDFGDEKAIELLADSGLRVSNLQWVGGFTGSDGRSFRESLNDARGAITLAGQLKADSVVVYTGARAGHTHNHARRLFRDAIKELIPLAEEHGVDLAIEPMHVGCAAGFTFLTCLDDTLSILQQADSAVVKMVFDTYHLGFDEANLERIGEIAPHLALVQLGDGKHPPEGEQDRCRLGDGCVPLERIVAALSTSGYDGYYDVELLGEEFECSDYCALLEHSCQTARGLLAG